MLKELATARLLFAALCCCGLMPSYASSQFDRDESITQPFAADDTPVLDAGSVRLRTFGVIAGSATAVAAYGSRVWWKDGLSDSFKTKDEGWFGQDTYAGGADKLGHFYSSYLGTRLLVRGLEWAGNSPERSLRMGAISSLAIMLGVEVLDGHEPDSGFSAEDMGMNMAGVGLGVLLEKYPRADEIFDLRFQYWPADARRRAKGVDASGDYDGHTYLLVAKASGVPTLRRNAWLKYLELAVGYGTVGFDAANSLDRRRFIYYGISLNLAEILNDTAFAGGWKGGRAQAIADTTLEFFQVPGTAGLADHRWD